MTHRPPTRADIGKMVECSDEGGEWVSGVLDYMVIGGDGPLYYMDPWRNGYTHCRVPVHSPDPVAELLVAADMLADQGLDEAARVLMLYPQLREAIDRIVIDEGIDAGVILIDGESHTQWNNELQRSEYTNPFFSQLGEALVMLSRMIKGTANDNSTQVADR